MADVQRKRIHECWCDECQEPVDLEVVDYHRAINRVLVEMDERSRRLFAGLLARQIGRGGIQRLYEITGLSRTTIRRGLHECQSGHDCRETDRVRRAGGGRKPIEKKLLN